MSVEANGRKMEAMRSIEKDVIYRRVWVVGSGSRDSTTTKSDLPEATGLDLAKIYACQLKRCARDRYSRIPFSTG